MLGCVWLGLELNSVGKWISWAIFEDSWKRQNECGGEAPWVEVNESLVLFPSTKKVREKAEYLICSLASNFWPVTNIRKTWTWEFVLSLNSWNLNLKSKRVHLPRSCQKKPVYRPLEEKWRTKRLSCLLSHRKQKEVTEKSKGKKKQQSD